MGFLSPGSHRFDSTLSRFEMFLGTILIAVGAAGLYLHAQGEFSRWGEHSDLERAVADLQKETGAVRYRRKGGLAWRDVSRETRDVGDGDAVFTGPDGAARLSFLQGGEATLRPNTLVIVDHPGNPEDWRIKWLWKVMAENVGAGRIDVRQGGVKLRLKPRDGPVVVRSGGKAVRVEPPTAADEVLVDLIAERPSESLRVVNLGKSPAVVVSGEAGDRKTEIRSGEEHSFQVSPEPGPAGRSVVTPEKIGQGDRWKNLELSAPAPAAPPAPKRAKTRRPAAPEPPTPWTATLVSKKKTGLVKTLRELESLPVVLSWKGHDGADSYRVEIRSASRQLVLDTSQPADKSKPVQSRELRLENLTSTAYFYRVIALSNGRTLRKMPYRRLRLELPVPVPVQPPHGSIYPTGHQALITWSRAPLTSSYRLQIARDPGFTSLVTDVEVTVNHHATHPLESGRYYWRVRAWSPFAKSHWSRARALSWADSSE